MLQQLGITTYRQIARWTERDIDEFDAKLPEFPGRIRRDGWVTQARALHAEQVRRRRRRRGTGERDLGRPTRAPHSATASPRSTSRARALIPIAMLTLVWGCNWPVLKMGVPEVAAAHVSRAHAAVRARCGLLADREARRRLDPRFRARCGARSRVLALFNITGWNGLAAVRPPAAARRAQRDPRVHDAGLERAVLARAAARAAVARARSSASRSACWEWRLLLGDDIRHLGRTPVAALLILGAVDLVGVRHRAAAQVEAAAVAEHVSPAG